MPYIGRAATNTGSVRYLDNIASGFDGSDTTFTAQVGGVNITPDQENVEIYLDGVFQHPGSGNAYTISGSTITFTEAPVANTVFSAYVVGAGSYLDDKAVSSAKLDDDAVTAAKLDDDGTGFQVGDLGVGGSLTSGDKLTVTGRLRASGGIIGDLTGDVTGNVTGNTSGTAATVTGAAQSAITSVGTLSSLTLSGDLTIPQKIVHSGDTDTYLSFGTDSLSLYTGGTNVIDFIYGNIYIKGNNKALTGYTTGGGAKELIKIDDSDIVQIGEGQDVSITGDGARFYVKSADEELISIGRAGSSGASLDQGYIRMKSGGSNKIALHTAGDSYLNGGSLGIGTDSPDNLLQLEFADGSNTSAGNIADESVTGLVLTNTTDSDGNGTMIKMESANGSNATAIGHIQEDDDSAHMAFYTEKDATFAERLRITSAGNVTIGAGNDTKELGVNRAKIRHLEGLADNANWTGAELYINHINNGNIYMSGTGSVGIGTSSINSNAKLHIRGASSGQTSSSNNTQLTVESSGTAGIQLLTGTTSVGGFWIGDSNGAETGGKLYYSNNTDFWQFYNSGSTDSLNISTSMVRLYNADSGSAGSTLKQLSMGWSTSTYWDTTDTGTFVGMSIANAHNDAGVGCGIQFVTRSSSSGISYIVSRGEASDSSSLHFGTRGTDGVARRMLIGADGSVNISANSNNKASINIVGTGTGQAPNDAKVYVSKNSANDWSFIGTGGGDNYGMKLNGAGSYALFITDHNQSGDVRSRISFDGYVYSTDGSIHDIDSDKRKKEDIDSAESQWQMLKDLPLQKFKWKDKRAGDKYSYGWIAQDVQKKYPELVSIVPQTKEDIENEVEDPEYLTVRTGDIHRLAIKALQEAMAKIETLEAKVEALENA